MQDAADFLLRDQSERESTSLSSDLPTITSRGNGGPPPSLLGDSGSQENCEYVQFQLSREEGEIMGGGRDGKEKSFPRRAKLRWATSSCRYGTTRLHYVNTCVACVVCMNGRQMQMRRLPRTLSPLTPLTYARVRLLWPFLRKLCPS